MPSSCRRESLRHCRVVPPALSARVAFLLPLLLLVLLLQCPSDARRMADADVDLRVALVPAQAHGGEPRLITLSAVVSTPPDAVLDSCADLNHPGQGGQVSVALQVVLNGRDVWEACTKPFRCPNDAFAGASAWEMACNTTCPFPAKGLTSSNTAAVYVAVREASSNADGPDSAPSPLLRIGLLGTVPLAHDGSLPGNGQTDVPLSLLSPKRLQLRGYGSTGEQAMRDEPGMHMARSVASPVASPAGIQSVGILYEVWHTLAAAAMDAIAAEGGQQVTVENVVQQQNLDLNDVLNKYNEGPAAANFYYQAKPSQGFYCVYKHRPGQAGIVPDCPNIQETLSRHAQQLHSSGVDYVVTDSTNLGTPSTQAEAIQVRPTEVLFEEWASLRKSGIATPAIAVWQTCRTGSTLYNSVLALYNNETYSDLVFRAPNGKKVFFVPSSPDPHILSLVESNGGRNDIVVVHMWALFDPKEFSTGKLGFFSPCVDPSSGSYTTSVVSDSITPCGQHMATNSPLGSVMSASPSYQLSYSSMPFAAASKFGGFTFKRQFAGVFSSNPDGIFMSSWNEFIAQPQSNPFHSSYAVSMGLDASDAQRTSLWVDTYGAFISRDIEPSVEAGDTFFSVMQSCLRVARLSRANSMTGCTVAGEACCTMNMTSEAYHNVWALVRGDSLDRLLTTDRNELQTLISEGWGTQVCNPYSGPTDFCVDTSVVSSSNAEAVKGPFVMASNPSPGARAIYRCITSAGGHFFSPQPDCEGQKTESLLGYALPQRTSNTPRLLTRCRNPTTGVHYHTLDAPCDAGDSTEGSYGYVH